MPSRGRGNQLMIAVGGRRSADWLSVTPHYSHSVSYTRLDSSIIGAAVRLSKLIRSFVVLRLGHVTDAQALQTVNYLNRQHTQSYW